MFRFTFLWTGAVLALLAFGCAAKQVSANAIVSSQSSIRAAEEVGAAQEPQAALHLKLAKEEVAQAQALIADDKPHRAELLLARATADADLAMVLARQATNKAEAQRALDQIRTLQPMPATTNPSGPMQPKTPNQPVPDDLAPNPVMPK